MARKAHRKVFSPIVTAVYQVEEKTRREGRLASKGHQGSETLEEDDGPAYEDGRPGVAREPGGQGPSSVLPSIEYPCDGTATLQSLEISLANPALR